MAIASADFDYIRKLVLNRSAIVLEPGKEYLVESRMLPLLHSEGLETIQSLVGQLRMGGSRNGLSDKVVDALTTNETSFFRDVHPFEALKKHVLPDILEKNKIKRELNIWCGASSSGQEPFTIAMILKNDFPELNNWKINFMSSDISREMLARCRTGKYSQLEVNRGLPAMLLVKFFERVGTDWKVKDDLLKMVQFREINLSEPFPPIPPVDIMFLRNVLIYFDVEMKKSILGKIKKVLKPSGYLFLGAAETTMNIDPAFERLPLPQSGCYSLKG
ncbi:MAG: protein-glutamate O-methyltransferase CheR [Candidatus Nitronauta litoralis]|uniref:protein-glutamate O-methyltransferase n=1 Tax=Candidatus Nitronauta litoralis TaxID=2705533 RepID=A0A7T0G111_9BACT|nr:MAG: protein-glutamate O-methyltransferase CheR [Candidatus Nitronauta litoralis]